MNVLLISECDKRALVETRRILDQFAERRGERTWQTSITQAGLDTLRRLLRKTARKNTAVACHWIRGRDHSELLWIVGDASRFNAEGAVPTNTTTRNILRAEDENDWHTAEDIRLLAQLAALLHDLGKATVAFQERLQGKRKEKNLYRHEWVSLRLFQAFVGSDDDEGWLRRLADAQNINEWIWTAPSRYQRDGLDAVNPYPFRSLPPLAQAIGWLIVTHHRLPVAPRDDKPLGSRVSAGLLGVLKRPLDHISCNWNELTSNSDSERVEPFWKLLSPLPVVGASWRKQAARVARRLLELMPRRGGLDYLDNPFILHLARLCLMLADHHYSSLPSSLPEDSPERVTGDGIGSYANTDRNGVPKQRLDEHLLGVYRSAGFIAHALPSLDRHLPRLVNHRGLRRRSADPRFSWQDKAADAAASIREAARRHGCFVINMASTGCGKTLGNIRMINALAEPSMGFRATYALGLRTLTWQTGRAYRQELGLGDDELAIRVGGSANRQLFEYYERQADNHGSASSQCLLDEDSRVLYEGNIGQHPLLSRTVHDPAVRSLLAAPILVCTVDHMVPATESLRAGRHIAPMLRLMSADLILDELDDYGLEDLPALTRLVYWAGMLGSRIVLSSATLPPALVEGMFLAYRAGRTHYRRNRGEHGGLQEGPVEIPCIWTDEFGTQTASCFDADRFRECHTRFVDKRSERLLKAEPLRRGDLLSLDIRSSLKEEQIRAEFAGQVRDACLRLHTDHAETDPISGKRVSFGMVRMANIDPLFDVARTLYRLGAPEDFHIHLCVYHARYPLIQRSAIERMLDTVFDRRKNGQKVYQLPNVRAAIDAHPERNHLFVVLASPVCEVGRDWDADWAVAEPSSMRSLIQLAGRVQRHRRRPVDKPNVLIFDTNLRWFEKGAPSQGKKASFVRPGFERDKQGCECIFRLNANRLSRLLAPESYRFISALPRIKTNDPERWNPKLNLVDLEHARITASMLPRSRWPDLLRQELREALEPDHAPPMWEYPQASLVGVLPQQQPFRNDSISRETLVFLPDEDEEELILHRIDKQASQRQERLYVQEKTRCQEIRIELGPRISPWGQYELMQLLSEHAEDLDLSLRETAEKSTVVEVPHSEQGWRYHPWLGFSVKG